MKNIAILGASLGDEAKGAVSHHFSTDFQFLVRVQGGTNVGAMVYRNGKKYIHHQLPTVDYVNSQAKSFLASGMVINLPALLEEIKFMQRDFPNVGKSVIVDPDAFVVLPQHIERDKVEGLKQGTTFQGIKQAYTDKVNRVGVRVYNFINDNAPIIQALKDQGVQFIPLLALRETFEKSKLLFEGNQGVMLDLEAGLYPFITSSDTKVSGIYSAGFHFVKLDKVFGVAKAGYVTRSGGQPLPTEMPEEESKIIVEKAGERGNTTGRARGIGYFDCVSLRYACLKGGITDLILTKLDVMNGQKKIKVCISYGHEVYSPADFLNITPEYIEVDGWENAANLEQIQPFINFVENQVGFPVEYITHGLNKEDFVKL